MRLAVLVAQFPISLNISKNLETISGVLEQSRAGDWVASGETAILRANLDLSLVSNWYLNQFREDVVLIKKSDE